MNNERLNETSSRLKMALVCTATSRRMEPAPRYLQMADQKPAPGTIKALATGTDSIDFTYPTRAMLRNGQETSEYFPICHGDPTHGMPNRRTMTNFVRWKFNYLCVSEGYIWVVDRKISSWSVANVRDAPLPNTRNDFLHVDGNTLTLVIFGERPDQVCVCEYDIAEMLQDSQPAESAIDTDIELTSSQNNAASGQVEHIAEEFDNLEIAQENEDEETNGPNCKICLSENRSLVRSVLLPCCHVACSGCISRWMRHNSACPFCRRTVEKRHRLFE